MTILGQKLYWKFIIKYDFNHEFHPIPFFTFIELIHQTYLEKLNYKMLKSKFSKLMLVLVGGLGLWGCYPDGPEYYDDTDITLTQFDAQFDFSSKQTYAMPDKIVVDVEIDNG